MFCMHAWYKKCGMICHAQECLINHALLPKYAQNFKDKERKQHNSNLNRFFQFSLFGRVTLSRSSFIQQIFFVKKTSFFFWSFLTWYIFYEPLFIPTCHFFTTFHLTLNKVFSKKTNMTFIFLFKIKHHSILGKKQNEKPFFVFFLQKFRTHFFDKSERIFSNPNDSHEIY